MKLSKILLLVAVVMAIALTGCDDFNFYEIMEGYTLTIENQTTSNFDVVVDGISDHVLVANRTIYVNVAWGENLITATEIDGTRAVVLEQEFYEDSEWVIALSDLDSKLVNVPTFDVTSTSLSTSMTARSVVVSGDDGYMAFTSGMLMMGPVLRGFIPQIVDESETEFQVDMPGGTTESFTEELDGSFTYTSVDTDISVSIGTDIIETILLDFEIDDDGDPTTANRDFTIYKTTTFSGDIIQDEFRVSFTGQGYINGPFDITDDKTDNPVLMTNMGIFDGEIAKTNTQFALLIKHTDGIVDIPDAFDPTTLSLNDPRFSTISQVKYEVLYYFDGTSYSAITNRQEVKDTMALVDPDWKL